MPPRRQGHVHVSSKPGHREALVRLNTHGERKIATLMVVLLNILLHWWRDDEWPYPRISIIGERVGTSRRTVERAIRSLQEKGLVIHRKRELIGNGPAIPRFDLSGLINVLQSKVGAWRGAKTGSAPTEDHQ